MRYFGRKIYEATYTFRVPRELTYKKSVLTIAPVIEYGRSNYDSYLDSGTHGSGKQKGVQFGAGFEWGF